MWNGVDLGSLGDKENYMLDASCWDNFPNQEAVLC